MRLRFVMMALLAVGCGGGGGDAYPTGPDGSGTGTGTGSGTGTGTGSGTATGSATVTVQQSDDGYGTAVFSFNPAAVTITVGGTVTWSNGSATVVHNVTFAPTPGAPANVANFSSGNSTRTFAAAGSYSYECTNHPGMAGQVTVR